MTFHQAQETALKFGAKAPRNFVNEDYAQCWIDRIAILPMAAERGRLADAIMEANRYA